MNGRFGLVASRASPAYNGLMPTLNERAYELCNAMAADAERLGIAVSKLTCGTRIIDCGVKAPGSIEAGLRLAEVCLSGLGTAKLIGPVPKIWDGQFVDVGTKAPVAACMASQYAGWEIKGERSFAMGFRTDAGRRLPRATVQ